MKKFPHLVQLHQKFADQGLVCVSLDVDQDDWTERKDDVTEFLKKQDAAFANFVFKDDKKVVGDWQDKYDANATPAYLAWDRTGNLVKMPDFADQAKPAFMEKFVSDLLAQK